MAFLNSVPIPIFRHQLLLAMAVAKQFNKTDMLRKMTRSMLVDWKKREMQKFDTLLWNETISDILRATAHESRPPQKKSPPSLIIAAEPHGALDQDPVDNEKIVSYVILDKTAVFGCNFCRCLIVLKMKMSNKTKIKNPKLSKQHVRVTQF